MRHIKKVINLLIFNSLLTSMRYLCIMMSFCFTFLTTAEPINPILNAEIDQAVSAPNIAKPIVNDLKQARNYPMQPPLIPHNIRGYEINLNVNKCMACHSRTKIKSSQAPMISVTHFMDRDGNFLAEISPRRYFCNQCHVPQTEVDVVVENNFIDMEAMLKPINQGAKHD